MAVAQDSLENILDTFTTGCAGVLIRPAEDQNLEEARAEIGRAISGVNVGPVQIETGGDSEQYPWVLFRGTTLNDITIGIGQVETMMSATGLGDRMLAVVYAFTWQQRTIYWIYQPKLGTYTSVVPKGTGEGSTERDHDLEKLMEQAVRRGREFPTTQDVSQWFPIWGIPF